MTLNIYDSVVPVRFEFLENVAHDVILGMKFSSQTKPNVDISSPMLNFFMTV